MVTEIAKGKLFCLTVPRFAFLYKVLGEFYVLHGEAKMTYNHCLW